jgi:hypothetical protein
MLLPVPDNMEEPQAQAAASAEELQDSIAPALQGCASGPAWNQFQWPSRLRERPRWRR